MILNCTESGQWEMRKQIKDKCPNNIANVEHTLIDMAQASAMTWGHMSSYHCHHYQNRLAHWAIPSGCHVKLYDLPLSCVLIRKHDFAEVGYVVQDIAGIPAR